MEEMDLGKFKETKTNCFAANNGQVRIEKCDYLHRLIHGLKYYQLLNPSTNKLGSDIFIEFINVYKNILNDYHHFINVHGEHLEDIHNQLINDKNFGDCLLDKCLLFRRQFDARRQKAMDKQMVDDQIRFYGNLFENIHYHLFHLYQIGMRTKKSEIKENNNDEKEEYECIDNEFKARRKLIESKRNKYDLKANTLNDSNNKFSLKVGYNEDNVKNKKETFMDSVYRHIEAKKVPEKIQQKFHQFIEDEEYDSDALMEDVCQDEMNSNIIQNENGNDTCGKLIKEYVEYYKLCAISFSTGITWFYWTWYKNRDNIPQVMGGNVNDYGGYDIKKLFVERKYENYKEEILQHIGINEYQQLVLFKAKELMISDKVKEIKAHGAADLFHCGFK
eukprot:162418_1